MSSQPTDELTDNIVGDIVDSLSTGIFANIVIQILTGKNPSFKSIVSMNTLNDGAKMGGAIALYRRVGRPMVNKAMNSAGLDNAMKL